MSVLVEQFDGRRLRVASASAEAVVDGSAESTGASRAVELLLGSLGSCLVGTMLSAAEEGHLDASDIRVELKPLVVDGLKRITMKPPIRGDLSSEQLDHLLSAATSFRVHHSLHTGIRTAPEVEHIRVGAR